MKCNTALVENPTEVPGVTSESLAVTNKAAGLKLASALETRVAVVVLDAGIAAFGAATGTGRAIGLGVGFGF